MHLVAASSELLHPEVTELWPWRVGVWQYGSAGMRTDVQGVPKLRNT